MSRIRPAALLVSTVCAATHARLNKSAALCLKGKCAVSTNWCLLIGVHECNEWGGGEHEASSVPGPGPGLNTTKSMLNKSIFNLCNVFFFFISAPSMVEPY